MVEVEVEVESYTGARIEDSISQSQPLRKVQGSGDRVR